MCDDCFGGLGKASTFLASHWELLNVDRLLASLI